MQKELKMLLDIFVQGQSVQPLVLSEDDLIASINYLNSSNFYAIEEIRDEVIPNLYLFETEDKSFKIETSRKIIEKATIRTQYDYNIFVIREIDKMTDQAANSLLKLLEDVPDRIIFFLTTNAKENILETIKSRILFFGSNEIKFTITENTKEAIDSFLAGEKMNLMKIILNDKIEKHESIGILEYMIEKLSKKNFGNKELLSKMLNGIEKIHSTNANPKYILDSIILDMD